MPKITQPTGLFKRASASEYTETFSRKTKKQNAKLFAITGRVFRGEEAAATKKNFYLPFFLRHFFDT